MSRKKILIITDSLGLPRCDPECLTGEECWTHRIANKNTDYDIYLFSRGGLSSIDIVKNINTYFRAYKPDIIIFQVGIVDCAPRALKFRELKFISSVPVLRFFVKKIIGKFRREIVNFRRITYVSQRDFEANLLQFKHSFPSAEIYSIKIAPATTSYEEHSPGVILNISKFNEVLESLFNVIDPYDKVDVNEILMSDNHHLNDKGQNLVFEKVKAIIFK